MSTTTHTLTPRAMKDEDHPVRNRRNVVICIDNSAAAQYNSNIHKMGSILEEPSDRQVVLQVDLGLDEWGSCEKVSSIPEKKQ
jgi:hypothetical protein